MKKLPACSHDDAQVVYNGGLFTGKEGIRRLYCDHFASGCTGRKIEPAPGFETDPAQQLDIVEVAADRKTATGQFPYSMQVGTPMTGDSSLVEMARLQGGRNCQLVGKRNPRRFPM